MPKPIAVLISDVHYSLPNLKLADAAMRMAIAKANDLQVPLIVAGDLHDTKANLRAECVRQLIHTFKVWPEIKPYIIIGNHDRINEKSELHALTFLKPYAHLIDQPAGYPWSDESLGLYLVPYHHETAPLIRMIKSIPKGSTLIMHQGITGSNSGEYIQDKSAITKDDVAGMRVISGHYHSRQTIKLPDGGKWDYIGNPFTTNFGEANDPPKGFQILMDDGNLEFVPTNLRKHRIIEYHIGDKAASGLHCANPEDPAWIKITGTKEQLALITKDKIYDMFGVENFRLDLIPLETLSRVNMSQNLTQAELLDQLIDSLTNTSDEAKIRLKQTWKDLA